MALLMVVPVDSGWPIAREKELAPVAGLPLPMKANALVTRDETPVIQVATELNTKKLVSLLIAHQKMKA